MSEDICQTCANQIVLFGARRGGVYCQENDLKPFPIWNKVTDCPDYTPDKGQKHQRKFMLNKYPGLLTQYEKKCMRETNDFCKEVCEKWNETGGQCVINGRCEILEYHRKNEL